MVGEWVELRFRSRIEDRGSRIEDRGSRIEDRISARRRSSTLDPRSSSGYRRLVELELKFEVADDVHRLTVFHRRLKASLLGRFDGLPGQTVRQSSFHFKDSDPAIGAENYAQYHRPLDIVVQGFP